MEHGPLEQDEAEARLRKWWAEQPEAQDAGSAREDQVPNEES
jgi:poly(A) polymerase